MTDEELAKDYVLNNTGYSVRCYHGKKAMQVFLAGFKVGKGINTVTRWHKVADGDLPKEKKLYLATTKEGSLILAYYNGTYWETKYNMNVMGHVVEIIVAWCEIPKYTEEEQYGEED